MKLDIVINKYLLMWHLLYQSSVSHDIHTLKQQLWGDYKKEYSAIYKEKGIILNDLDNYIPDDDLIFNLVENSPFYKKIKQETARYRITLQEIWDKSKKDYLSEMDDILKFNFNGDYTIVTLHPNLDVIEEDFKNNIISIGKKINFRDKDNFLTFVIYKIMESEFVRMRYLEKDIVEAVLELAILNELYTRISKDSKYNLGKPSLRDVKNKIYPYFLMYLGVNEEDMEKYPVQTV